MAKELLAYPSFRYRDDPEKGLVEQRVNDPDDEASKCPIEDGWRHNPDPNAPASEDPNEVRTRLASRTATGEPLPVYPSFRYRKDPETGERQEKRVENPEDEALSCPPDEGWTDFPGELDGQPRPAQSTAPLRVDPNAGGVEALDPAAEAEAAEVHMALKSRDLIASIIGCTSTEELMRIHAREMSRPDTKGGQRRTVLNAINTRMNELVEKRGDKDPQAPLTPDSDE